MEKETVNDSRARVSSLSVPIEPTTDIQHSTNTTSEVTVSLTTLPVFQPTTSIDNASAEEQPVREASPSSEQSVNANVTEKFPEFRRPTVEELETEFGERHEGKIVKWVPHKGYGFIQTRQSEYDYFFHATDILPRNRDHMNIGENVTFSITGDESGSQAKERAIGVLGDGSGQPIDKFGQKYHGGRWSSSANRKQRNSFGGNRKPWNRDQGSQRKNKRSSESKNKISSESWRANQSTHDSNNDSNNRRVSTNSQLSSHSSGSNSNLSNEQYARNQLMYAVISPQQQALWQAFCSTAHGVSDATFVSTPPPNAQVITPQDNAAMLQMNWNNAMAASMYNQQQAMMYGGYQTPMSASMCSRESLDGNMDLSHSFQDLSMYNNSTPTTAAPMMEGTNTSQNMVNNSFNDTTNFHHQQQPMNSYNMQQNQQYAMNPALQGVNTMQQQYAMNPAMYYDYPQQTARMSSVENQAMDMNNMYLQAQNMDPRVSFIYSNNALSAQLEVGNQGETFHQSTNEISNVESESTNNASYNGSS